MPKYRYELTVHEDDIDIIRDDNDGMITLYLEGDIDEIDVSSVDLNGDRQNDILWGSFEHNFVCFDDEGNEIEFDYHTGEPGIKRD